MRPQIVLSLKMALCGSTTIPVFCCLHVERNTASKAIGLGQVELRIGIALDRQGTPQLNSGRVVATFPSFDAALHICTRCDRRRLCNGLSCGHNHGRRTKRRR